MKKIISILIILLLLTPHTIKGKEVIDIYFFHSNTCIHCKEEEKALKILEKKYQNIKIHKYEVHDEKTKEILKQVGEVYKIPTNSVPITIIGNIPYIGYTEKYNIKFTRTIEYLEKYPYQDNLKEDDSLENKNIPTLEEYLNKTNRKVLGFNIDKIEPTILSILLAIQTEINLIEVLSLIIILCLLIKIEHNQIKIISFYFLLSYLLKINRAINSYLFIGIISFLLLGIYLIREKNKKTSMILTLTSIYIVLIQIVCNLINKKNLLLLKEIPIKYLLSRMNIIHYYSNYFLTILLINIVMFLFITTFFTKLDRR